MADTNRISVWVPELVPSKGGIQVFSGFLVRALKEADSNNVTVISKHDLELADSADDGKAVRGSGRWPPALRTHAFAAKVLWEGMRTPPDLILMTHLNFAVAAHWLKRWMGVPYWCVVHGIEAWDIHHQGRIAALKEADRVLAVSHHTKDRLLQQVQLAPERVRILSNTVDANRFRPGPKPLHLLSRHGLSVSRKIMLTVARLVGAERYKGYDTILHALPAIRRSVPEVHYILAGEGPDRPRVEELVQDLGLHDCVTLTGFVPDAELVDYYNLCDVFAMPSKGEGFGIVYLEAMACGKPVLAGNKDGSVDALRGGEFGVLIDPDSIEEIASALIQLLQHRHPHFLANRPDLLRKSVIEVSGLDAFRKTLFAHLTEFFNSNGPKGVRHVRHSRHNQNRMP
jgi:glycosyltransferase involved in cell wall biosynthesis